MQSYRSQSLRARLLNTSAAALLAFPAAMASGGAFAQDQDEDDTLEEEIDTVIVTGSRIARAEFSSSQPTITIDSTFIDDRGFTNVADALNELPSFGLPGSSTSSNQGASNVGANFVNLFSLGSQRTLTLVNGRRVVAANAPTNFNAASPGLQVDLNIIPTALVDRIENVSIGGAPIYGSDAISGTVNIILKKDYEGFDTDVQYGITQRGDADNFRIRSLLGGNFADGRGNVTLAVEYNRTEGLTGPSRREFRRSGLSFQPTADCGGLPDGTPFGRCLITDARVLFATDGGLPSGLAGVPSLNQGGVLLFEDNGFSDVPIQAIDADGELVFDLAFDADGDVILDMDGNPTFALDAMGEMIPTQARGTVNNFFATKSLDNSQLQFGPGSSLINFDPGTRGTNIFAQGGDGADTLDFSTLRTPLERLIINSNATYKLNDNVQLFMETMYANTKATDLLSQAIWWTDFFGGNGGSLEMPISNPFLAEPAREVLRANNDRIERGLGMAQGALGDNVFVSRDGLDILDGNNSSEMNMYRIVTGLEGEIDVFGNQWSWDVAYNVGRTRVDSVAQEVNDQRLEWALDAVLDPDTGEIVCDVTLNFDIASLAGTQFSVPDFDLLPQINGCVPLNIFGFGSPSAEALAYISEDQTSVTKLQQQVISANITGELFEMPAGPLATAFGVTHRREQSLFEPDESLQRAGGRSLPVSGTKGGFNTYEIYGEFLMPLVSDGEGLPITLPFINALDVEGALRFVDNNLSGTDQTWSLGGTLGLDLPIFDDMLEIKGNFTRSIRSPALLELFLPIVPIFTFVGDPCDSGLVGGGPLPATRRANCEAMIAALNATNPDGSAIDLDSFQSNARNGSIRGTTGGNPNLQNEKANSWIIGGVLTPTFIPGLSVAINYINISIEGAITNLNATALAQACFDAVSFPNPFCDFLTRDSNFQLTNAVTGFANAGFEDFDGIQASFQYNRDMADMPFIGDSLAGQLGISGNIFHRRTHKRSITGFDLNKQDGEIGRSSLRVQLNLRYNMDRFGWLLQGNYTSGAKFNNDNLPGTQEFLTVGNYYLFNTTFTYQLTDGVALRAVVNNMFDVRPPFPTTSTAYDFLGRNFFLGLRSSF